MKKDTEVKKNSRESRELNEYFEKIYKRLNKAQKEAVDTIDGPVMVIAGPGTGKTTILTLRIANILRQTDIDPSQILALTFTESGVNSMRKKIIELIGVRGYKVNISTFHSFANDMIRQFPERFPRIIGSSPINEIEKARIFNKIIIEEQGDLMKRGDYKLELIRPYGDTAYYIRHVESAIQELKRENIKAIDFIDFVKKERKSFDLIDDLYHQKGAHKGKMKGEYIKLKERLDKNIELAHVYLDYEESLKNEKFYDFEDMIMELSKKMKEDSDFKLILQENYQYILADEHQDANNAQNSILELLSDFHDSPNLFIVGDEKQAIFRFQGASLENFLYFKKKYKDAKLINLEENYRSHQNILDITHSLIEKNLEGGDIKRIPLLSKSEHKDSLITITEAENIEDEAYFIAKKIELYIKNGSLPQEIAVIYRNNRDSILIKNQLERLGIECAVESQGNIFENSFVKDLMAIIRAISNLTDDELVTRALFSKCLSIDPVEIYKCIDRSKKERVNLIDVANKTWKDIIDRFKKWSTNIKSNDFTSTIEDIINDSGALSLVVRSENSLEHLEALRVFLSLVRNLGSKGSNLESKEIIAYLEELSEKGGKELRISIKIKNEGRVRLMTAHKSKGLEFDHVFIPHLNDGVWSNTRDRVYFHLPHIESKYSKDIENNRLDDDRRLLYVAMTRARKTIDISYYKLKNDNISIALRSEFIDEMNAKDIVFVDSVSAIKKYGKRDPEKMFDKKDIKSPNILDKEYIIESVKERGISVTALNNYIECPWKYIFSNVIRLPEKMSRNQMFGIAIHGTLQTYFNKYKEDEIMKDKDALSLFEHKLKEQPLSLVDFNDSLKKGMLALGGYIREYKSKWSKNIRNELSIKGVYIGDDKRVHITGQIDKIEYMDSSSVNVVDYKTKKPMTRNEIEGKTKGGDGRYKRQLNFYKLLLDLYFEGEYIVKTAELDFIVPDDKGRYKKERFDINEQEVFFVQKEVLNMIDDLFSFNFWDKRCTDSKCKYCGYRDLIY